MLLSFISVPRQRAFHFKSEGGMVLLSFIYLLSNYQRQRVVHFKSEGGMVLLSFIYLLSNYQRQRVVHFKSEGHRWAWGDCQSIVFNTSLSFLSKEWVTGGFVFSACLGGCSSS